MSPKGVNSALDDLPDDGNPLGHQGRTVLVWRTLKKWIPLSLLAVTAVIVPAGIRGAQAQQALIVALGASNTAGEGVAPDQAYPAQLEALLRAKGYAVQVRNAGIGGDTTGGMLARLDSDVPEATRLVLLQVGSNDARKGLDQNFIRANVQQIISRLKERRINFIRIDSIIGRIPSALRQSDKIHLSADGYRMLAEAIAPRVLRVLR